MRETRPDTGRERLVQWYFIAFGLRFGLEANAIHFVGGPRRGERYLDQLLFHFGLFTIRFHCFRSGDDQRAVHDHPFWFWTFPLHGYNEQYWDPVWQEMRWRRVKPFRFHYRPAEHRHLIYFSPDDRVDLPIWTICLAGPYRREWFFWPSPNYAVPASAWEQYCCEHDL